MPGSAIATATKQTAYADWKASLFANVGSSRHVRADGVVTYDFQPLPELAPLRQGVYVDKKKVFDDDYLKRLSPLSLALWYMDDAQLHRPVEGRAERGRRGSPAGPPICVEAMEPATRERLVAYLADTWGIRAKLVASGAREEGRPGLRQRRDGEAARPDRAVRAPEHGVQAAPGVPGSVRRRARSSRRCATSWWPCR